MASQTERWRLVPILLRCAGLLCIALTALWPSPLADAGTPGCPDVRPAVGGGSSDSLGAVAELSLNWCPGAPWSLITGLRYMMQPNSINPFLVLAYERPLGPHWHLRLDASVNERSGDTLLNRLPELNLRWSPASSRSVLVPSLELSLGSIFIYNSQMGAVRAGAVFSLSPQPIHFGTLAELTSTVRVGTHAYGNGQTNDFWGGTASLVIHPTLRTEVGLTYSRQEGTGASPLGYDNVAFDQTASGRISVVLSPSATVSVTANMTLVTQPANVTEYVFAWTRPGKWSIGFTWRQSDGRVLLGAGLSP